MARSRASQKKEVDVSIPDEYAELIGDLAEHPAYLAAWAHAKRWGNSNKGCMVYAENHWQDYQNDDEVHERAPIAPPDPAGMSEEALDAEIKRLTEVREARASGGKK